MSTLIPRLRVVLPDPAKNVHAHAFDEIALVLVAGLRRLGVRVEPTLECTQGDARVLVLAPHLQRLEDLDALSRDAVLYTWEPLGWLHAALMTPALTALMSQFVIWDYSANNLRTWRQQGAGRVVHTPLGFDPALERIRPTGEPPVADVLFYGSITPRRRDVLLDLKRRGLRVQVLFGVYGRERDEWIARSRVVLNLHAHEGQILELPRLAYLWANRVPLVAEVNTETEDALAMTPSLVRGTYDNLADVVEAALGDPTGLEAAAEASYTRFVGQPHMAELLRRAFSADV